MTTPLFYENQAPSEIINAICGAGPKRWEELHKSDRGPVGLGKLRLAGLYDDRFEGTFMLRTRIPAGRLSADQLRVIADVVRDFSIKPEGSSDPDRFAEITTRQDLQIHWIHFEDLPEIWRRYGTVGLSSVEACGNTMRNVTACPVDRVAPDSILEVSTVVQALEKLVADDERLSAFLPRKFKIAITGCITDCVIARVNDLAFTPARRGTNTGFNIHVGGGLSDYPRLASALDIFVEPSQVPALTGAVLELFAAHGDYEHTSVNRFRALVHQLGPEAIEEDIRRRLPFAVEGAGQDLSSWIAEDHLGVHSDRSGTNYVGLCVPLGRVHVDDLAELSRLAQTYGDGHLRITQRQNIVLTGIEDTKKILSEPLTQRFRPNPTPFERGVVACTSAPFCKFAILPMKSYGASLIKHLENNVPEEYWEKLQGLRIHMSGCKASCAQVPLAHIGLRGAMGKNESGYFDAFDIALDGDAAAGHLARWTAGSVPADQTFSGIVSLLSLVAQRDGGLADIIAETLPYIEEIVPLIKEVRR